MPRHATQTNQAAFFLYSRKSTESEDRQVLSIDSQIDELKRLATRLNLRIVEVFSEARSAKAPGRPVFNEMMRRVHAGEAHGVVCWKLDRLARNPVDGGSLIWAVKQDGIRIVTPTQTYSHEDDNMILMYIEFGMAHKYIDDLGRAVKRGLRAKAERGLYPGGAPSGAHLGYVYDPTKPKGLRGLIPDSERFDLVQRLWRLMLTGGYSVTALVTKATEEWGFRTQHGRPLSRAALYRVFANPLYAGSFEYPRGSGQWFKGAHKPMVTESEFETVQALLGSKGRPRRIRHTFPFTGLIRCAACTGMVTGEEKRQMICPGCRHKFAYRGKDECPRCRRTIAHLLDAPHGQTPQLRHYVYYHCTRQTKQPCTQPSVRQERLEEQLAQYLRRIQLAKPFQHWVLAQLRTTLAEDRALQEATRDSRRKALRTCLARLDNLVRLKTAPENSDGSLLSDEEYARQRGPLLKEKATLEIALKGEDRSPMARLPVLEEVFQFVNEAPGWLTREDPETKRLILAVFATGDSNLTLGDKLLRIDAPKPFPILEGNPSLDQPRNDSFEPPNIGFNKSEKDAFASSRPTECGQRNDVRTCRSHEVLTKRLPSEGPLAPYGTAGSRVVQSLRDWLATSPERELVALRAKLGALFEKLKDNLRSAA